VRQLADDITTAASASLKAALTARLEEEAGGPQFMVSWLSSAQAVAADSVMTVDNDGIPPEIDTSKPHAARMYDYFLGGKDNFAADRETAGKALEAWPAIRTASRENRAFLGRAVRYLAADAGITQFLDIGSGLPGVGNVHEVAQEVNPAARVVYVDNDPIVLAHGHALLVSKPQGRSVYIDADIREPEKILSHPVTRDVLDFTQPVALILVSVLHFFTAEDQVRRIVGPLTDALPSGSYVAASHATAEFAPATIEAGRAYTRGGVDVIGRDADVFADLVFPGLTLVPPGVTVVSEWRPEPGTILPSRADVSMNGAVARKPLSPDFRP
jgi:S-adenosyl methyltransferase